MANILDIFPFDPVGAQLNADKIQAAPVPTDTAPAMSLMDGIAQIGGVSAKNLPEIAARNANAAVAYAKIAATQSADIEKQQADAADALMKAKQQLDAIEIGDAQRKQNIKNQIMPQDDLVMAMSKANQIQLQLQADYSKQINALNQAGQDSANGSFLDKVGAFISGINQQSQAPATAEKIKNLSVTQAAMANQYAAQLQALQEADKFAPAPELIQARQLVTDAQLLQDITKDKGMNLERRIAQNQRVFEVVSIAVNQIYQSEANQMRREEFEMSKKRFALESQATMQRIQMTGMEIKNMQQTQSYYDSLGSSLGIRGLTPQAFQTMPDLVKHYGVVLTMSRLNGGQSTKLADGTVIPPIDDYLLSLPVEKRSELFRELKVIAPKEFDSTRIGRAIKQEELLTQIGGQWKPTAQQLTDLSALQLKNPDKANQVRADLRKQFAMKALQGNLTEKDGMGAAEMNIQAGRYMTDPDSPTNLGYSMGSNLPSFMTVLKQTGVPQKAQDIILSTLKNTQVATPQQFVNAVMAPLVAEFGDNKAAEYISKAGKAHITIVNDKMGPELLGNPPLTGLPMVFYENKPGLLTTTKQNTVSNMADPVDVLKFIVRSKPENQVPTLIRDFGYSTLPTK